MSIRPEAEQKTKAAALLSLSLCCAPAYADSFCEPNTINHTGIGKITIYATGPSGMPARYYATLTQCQAQLDDFCNDWFSTPVPGCIPYDEAVRRSQRAAGPLPPITPSPARQLPQQARPKQPTAALSNEARSHKGNCVNGTCYLKGNPDQYNPRSLQYAQAVCGEVSEVNGTGFFNGTADECIKSVMAGVPSNNSDRFSSNFQRSGLTGGSPSAHKFEPQERQGTPCLRGWENAVHCKAQPINGMTYGTNVYCSNGNSFSVSQVVCIEASDLDPASVGRCDPKYVSANARNALIDNSPGYKEQLGRPTCP